MWLLKFGAAFLFINIFSFLRPINTYANNVQNGNRALFGLFFDPCSNCKCGVPNRESRILGGEYLRSYEFPWLALINNFKDNSIFLGTLINNKYVITAASVLVGSRPYDIKVTLGQYDRCAPDIISSNVSTEKIIVHPEFNPIRRVHDIALIRLPAPVVFEKRVSPVCLAYPSSKYVGQVGTVVSWFGGTEKEKDILCRPRKLGVPILGKEQCVADGGLTGTDKGCLGVLGSASFVCKEDKGGPVLYRSYEGVYELIGIISEGNECSSEQPSATYFSTVGKHLQWIVQNTRDACYCYKT